MLTCLTCLIHSDGVFILLINKEDAIDRRLAAAKSRGNRCCQTSVTSEKSRKSLLPDVCHQRKLEEIAAARQTDFYINVSYEYSVQYLKEI